MQALYPSRHEAVLGNLMGGTSPVYLTFGDERTAEQAAADLADLATVDGLGHSEHGWTVAARYPIPAGTEYAPIPDTILDLAVRLGGEAAEFDPVVLAELQRRLNDPNVKTYTHDEVWRELANDWAEDEDA